MRPDSAMISSSLFPTLGAYCGTRTPSIAQGGYHGPVNQPSCVLPGCAFSLSAMRTRADDVFTVTLFKEYCSGEIDGAVLPALAPILALARGLGHARVTGGVWG